MIRGAFSITTRFGHYRPRLAFGSAHRHHSWGVLPLRSNKKVLNLATGMAIGIGIGAAVGELVFGNIAIGIAVGTAIGAAAGHIFSK